MRFSADVNTIGGGRFYCTGAAASVGLDTVSGASVSMLFARRGAKKFSIGTSPAEGGTAAFYGERAASAVECFFRLFTSLKPSPWLDRPSWLLAFRRLLKSLSVTVYVAYSALYGLTMKSREVAISVVRRPHYCNGSVLLPDLFRYFILVVQ
jgi:hypothetical protein